MTADTTNVSLKKNVIDGVKKRYKKSFVAANSTCGHIPLYSIEFSCFCYEILKLEINPVVVTYRGRLELLQVTVTLILHPPRVEITCLY